jgi:hypothetical protein
MRISEFSRSDLSNAVVVAWASCLSLAACGPSSDSEAGTDELPRGLRLNTPDAALGYVYFGSVTALGSALLRSDHGNVYATSAPG